MAEKCFLTNDVKFLSMAGKELKRCYHDPLHYFWGHFYLLLLFWFIYFIDLFWEYFW